MAHILRHLDRGATAIQTGIAEGQDLNYEAFSTSYDGTGPFADAIRDAVGQMLPVIGDGRPVPLPWLWHGGRLLPALVMAAGQETGIDVGGVLRVAQGHDYSLLPRACAEGVQAGCARQKLRLRSAWPCPFPHRAGAGASLGTMKSLAS